MPHSDLSLKKVVMAMLNQIVLMGRLTKDPEVRYVGAKNTPVASFTVAVEREFSSGNEKQTDFINCKAWNKTAEFVQKYFSKGNMIALTGSLQSDKYTDKSGQNKIWWEVNVNNVYFTGEKNDSGTTPARSSAPVNVPPPAQDDDGFVPFEDDGDLPF